MKKINNLHWSVRSEELYVLNLDKNFDPIQIPRKLVLDYKKFNFPGGDPHLQILTPLVGDEMVITHRVNSGNDIIDILLANDAAKRAGVKDIKLVIPCFPAMRQDRVCNQGEPLTLKVFADLINGCGFSEVVIFAPHSEVTPALLNNVTVVDELVEAVQVIRDTLRGGNVIEPFNIVSPDGGAGKRVGKIVKALVKEFPLHEFNLIRCEKERDVTTGELKGFYVQADDLGGYHTVIFDDTVAYGGTFLGLADELRKKGAGALSIFTAAADCQAGIDNLVKKFDHVYTTNTKHDFHNFEDLINLHILPFIIK